VLVCGGCGVAGSEYNVLSAGTAPCTVSASVASPLALACSVDVTSTEVDEQRACAVGWQRLTTAGRYGNVTSSLGGYSVWKTVTSERGDDDDGDTAVLSMLQIDSVQRDDFTRFA